MWWKGFVIKEPSEVRTVMHNGMSKQNSKSTMIGAYTDAFEHLLPPKMHKRFVWNIAGSILKGPTIYKTIGVKLYRDQLYTSLHDIGKKVHNEEP